MKIIWEDRYVILFVPVGKRCPMCKGTGQVKGYKCVFGTCTGGFHGYSHTKFENVKAGVFKYKVGTAPTYTVHCTNELLDVFERLYNAVGYATLVPDSLVGFYNSEDAETVAERINNTLNTYWKHNARASAVVKYEQVNGRKCLLMQLDAAAWRDARTWKFVVNDNTAANNKEYYVV